MADFHLNQRVIYRDHEGTETRGVIVSLSDPEHPIVDFGPDGQHIMWASGLHPEPQVPGAGVEE